MKNRKLIRLLCLILCAVMLFAGCASDDESDKKEKKATEAPKPAGEESGPAEEPTGEATPAAKPGVPASYDFSSVDSHIEKMIREAVEQYNKEDYTPLDEPVKYYVLWLGFTHVTFGDLDFQMTDFDRDYLEAVTLNYEKSVESISNHNVDITVYFHLIDDTVPLTQAAGADWLYLDMQTVMPYITHYMEGREIDTVLTTVQTAGEENRARNEGKDGYGVHDVMLGLKTDGIESPLGYSTFNLVTPAAGTYPLADPEIPSLYATAVAVHEWMHQLEYLETLLGVEYPDTHAYMGPESYPGYEKYTADLNDYDFFEFYKLVLTGKCPYTGNGSVKHVGMYPKMWPLIKRNVFNLGNFTIKAADGSGYLVGREAEIGLTLGDEECVWNISYSGNGRFVLKPKELPNMRIDLGNAWDAEGNTVGIWVYTGYDDAQSWHLSLNDDGTYSIKTPYPSGRVVTAKKGEKALLNTLGAAEGVQRWIIEAK
ncbi:MAG: RICIN domain-containing protein [Lachnospiraceae bacterium]|nr:RICIN domain-containing protein [Lachnospiraceae bacterium]